MAWIRECQECGYRQVAKDPATYKDDRWRDLKCRRCKSEALDYGSEVTVGNPEPDDDEEPIGTCREIPRSDPRFEKVMEQIVWREPEETGDHSRFQADQ